MTIRKARTEDLERIMQVLDEARRKMRAEGNLVQWVGGYPDEDLIRSDIASGAGYCIDDDNGTVGYFALVFGREPTYGVIEGGAWLDDTSPYATIHRLGSAKGSSGVAEACFNWCWELIPSLRVDTHEDNAAMRHCILKAGFRYCGVIHIADGTPRLAYQKI